MTAAVGKVLLSAQLDWQKKLMAEVKAMNTSIFIEDTEDNSAGVESPGALANQALLERPSSDRVRQLLEQQERLVRVKTDKYLHSISSVRTRRRESEKSAYLAQASENAQRLQRELGERDDQLRLMAETLQQLHSVKTSLEGELTDFRRREATVIEKARRREAALEAQLESARRVAAERSSGVDESASAAWAAGNEASPGSEGSPLPPPPPPAASIGGKFGTTKLHMFGRQQ
jgi:hypothetical protein